MKHSATAPVRYRVLVADDDRIVRVLLTEGLKEAGFDVVAAQDGESALEICLRQPPDLALLDIRMPGLSGIELARRLVEQTQVPFIFLTAYDDRALIEEAVEAGAFGYLVKPVEVPRLLPMLHAALARAEDLRKSREAEQGLAAALVSNRDIAMAVGMLMQRYGVTAETAFEAMRSYARRHQKKAHEIAHTVLSGASAIDLGL